MRARVWFHRISAMCWLLAGIVAWPLGWAASLAFVVIASVYANVKSDWGAAEAADDTAVMDRLDRLQWTVDRLLEETRTARYDQR
jgi:hypothetical protein